MSRSKMPTRLQLQPAAARCVIRFMVLALIVAASVTASGRITAAEPSQPRDASAVRSWHDQIQPFLQTYCLDCHSGSEQAAELDLGQLKSDLSDAELMRRWVLVHDRVAAGEMPPADQAAAVPTKSERAAALSVLAGGLEVADRAQSDVVLRRLNRNEYENTVRDLFGVYVAVKQVLPQDSTAAGFDNVGEGLAVSAEAALAYLQAADMTLDAVFGPARPPKRIEHRTNLLDQKTFDGKPMLANKIGSMFRQTPDGLVIFQSGYCPTNLVNFARLRPPAGTYRGTIRARAIQSDRPVTLRVYGGDTIVGRREKHVVGYYDIPPDEWTTIEFTDRLVEPGGTYQPKCYGTRDTRKNADTYPEPGIELGEITITGPLEEWPPASRRRLLGEVDPQQGTLEDARNILARSLPRAFRRPVSPEEVDTYVGLVADGLDRGRPFEESLRIGLQAVLCSPSFLFLNEPGQAEISQSALASRLSYFLWSSMPDDELLDLAAERRLADSEVLREQVERMLEDPKSRAFTTNFVGQWLDLRDIDFTQPDQNLYPEFDELLRISMVEETHRYFQHVLDADLSLLAFVDSDFSFLNERLARHYGIPGVEGQAFRRVSLPAESVRGGVLTQASVLKVTANGTSTSPVMRGAWVLENILGQTAPPPPSGVPAVEPDIRGATTLREQLARHRNEESCAVCHNQIDPPGFALESFDVIGGWRERYRTLGTGERPGFSQHPITFAWVRYRIGPPVDATGTTPDGTAFRDIREFKAWLQSRRRTIAEGLTRKLVTYALGRRVGFSDRPAIERIVASIEADDWPFRSLVHEIVQSELFRRP